MSVSHSKKSTKSPNTNPSIPFLDLVTPHLELEQELTEVFLKAIRTAGFIGGPMVEDFEKAFATFCSTTHAVAISSGTDALRFALTAEERVELELQQDHVWPAPISSWPPLMAHQCP